MHTFIHSAAGVFSASLLILSGCKTASDNFVAKSDEELNQLEKQAAAAHEQLVKGAFPAAEQQFRKLAGERTVSQTLYKMELLSTLLLQNKDQEAHTLLLQIHNDIETLTDEKQSEKAKSLWHGEQNKVFKGDSYERSTFYALLALSFLRSGNYEDALRSVKNGLLADADSNSGKAVGDNVMLLSIGAFTAGKMGDETAAGEYLRAIRSVLPQRGLSMPENAEDLPKGSCFAPLYAPPGNVILVVWTGRPPTVECAGEYNEKRCIIKGSLPFDALSVSIAHQREQLFPQALGDVNYQATTRGGRLMDNILEDKAEAKKITELSRNIFFIAGSGLLTAGGIVLNSNTAVGASLMGAGGCCYAVGGICWIVGSMMNPEADARYWKNLPYQFFMMPLSLPSGEHTLLLKGTFCGDRVINHLFKIQVDPALPVNVIHLSLLNQGEDSVSVIKKMHEQERIRALKKANANPMSKELK